METELRALQERHRDHLRSILDEEEKKKKTGHDLSQAFQRKMYHALCGISPGIVRAIERVTRIAEEQKDRNAKLEEIRKATHAIEEGEN